MMKVMNNPLKILLQSDSDSSVLNKTTQIPKSVGSVDFALLDEDLCYECGLDTSDVTNWSNLIICDSKIHFFLYCSLSHDSSCISARLISPASYLATAKHNCH